MSYVIVRTEVRGREFVAAPGSASSYTRDLTQARTFSSREAAEREACGNENVHRAEEFLRR